MNTAVVQISEAEISRCLVSVLEDLRQAGVLSYFVNIEGGRRDIRQQVSLKRQGARPGRPDLEIFFKRGKTIFVELKRLKGGRLSPYQKKELKALKGLGFECHVLKAVNQTDATDQLMRIIEDAIGVKLK